MSGLGADGGSLRFEKGTGEGLVGVPGRHLAAVCAEPALRLVTDDDASPARVARLRLLQELLRRPRTDPALVWALIDYRDQKEKP